MTPGLLFLITQLGPAPEPEHTGYLIACPLMLCTLSGAATGLVGLAYASANFPAGEEPAYSALRHGATALVVGVSSALGASTTAYLVGRNLFDIPPRVSFGRTFLGGLAGGVFGLMLIPYGMLSRTEGKVLALVSASFFSALGASLVYEWPYLQENFQPEPSPPLTVRVMLVF